MSVDTVVPEVEAPEVILNIQDRCDQCGAQAYVYAVMESGELMFCSHHYTKYADKIAQTAVRIVDQRHQLFEQELVRTAE